MLRKATLDPNLTLRQIERECISIDVDEDEIQTLAAEMLNEERNNPDVESTTVQRHLAGVRRYLAAIGVSNPLANYKGPVPASPKAHPLEGGEATVDKMIEAADHDYQKCAMVALTGYMALRISESRTVRVAHVDLIKKQLKVRGKGDSWEWIPIARSAMPWLFLAVQEAKTEGRDTLISAADRTVRKWYSELASVALGRPVVTDGTEGSHASRHAVGTDVYRKSKDLLLTSRVLRQRDPKTATVYIQTGADEIRSALDNRN